VRAIPQRELRNNVSEVLRRAQAGERFTVTVNGRPAAELGPHVSSSPRPLTSARLVQMLSEADVDGGWPDELERMRVEDAAAARDPWTD
jgi:prevent-host-death family protein